ncbi:glycoside-pentoside-hexuronide (GPH):cation symporter [Georgenia sp. EYE_87]|uniref:glycoside-pentoside-hexuronide (GPH):cation symporter n=1 Tax=Georgenia sp. EYE_87 TaxID=2853448 RepID=UPI002003A894|nr:glycoside-pentoside-hexuronide (GPH):cation symporter [Georgenia sp. EYE_87]MCK6211198.1 glycoside-pentoside-hexuronide (GPH):cation symporter [Georgenia sp. EYE_87]
MDTTASPAAGGIVAPRKLTVRNYLAYAAGDAANNLSFTMASFFLILYYTNVVGIEGAVVGTMFLVVRFVDAFTDLIAGRLVDAKRPGKLGKFRPFILWFSLPLLLASMAIYSARTFFPEISGGAAVAYMYATYLLMGSVFYTLVNIAYGSMAPALTQDPVERSRLAVFRGYGAALAILGLAFAIAPQIRANVDNPVALQRSLFLTTAAFVVIGMVLYLFLVSSTREQVARPATPVSLRDSLRTLTTNKPLMWLSLGAVLFLTAVTALSTLGSYIAIYVQQNAQYIAWNILAQTIAILVVGPLIPTLVRTIGKRSGFVIFGVAVIVGAAVLAFSPLSSVPLLGPVAFFLMGLGINGANTLTWALEADTVEYGEWRTGNRTEGTTYAVFSFTRKMGQAIGGFVGGFALTWAGFSAARASASEPQEPGVAENIQLWTGGIIAGFALLSISVMFFYPLTEAKFREITAEIASRRAAAATGP